MILVDLRGGSVRGGHRLVIAGFFRGSFFCIVTVLRSGAAGWRGGGAAPAFEHCPEAAGHPVCIVPAPLPELAAAPAPPPVLRRASRHSLRAVLAPCRHGAAHGRARTQQL